MAGLELGAEDVEFQKMLSEVQEQANAHPEAVAQVLNRWISQEDQQLAGSGEISPVRKAAVVLLAVGPEQTAQVLKHMSPETVEQVMRELAALGRIDDTVHFKIVEEFYHIHNNTTFGMAVEHIMLL
eukprot:TRINITY_DN2333_c0_g2_i1.p3 TRINITY_DN2333_c0_g2~~TRINITY_DN2333_c0_g2_i1.p3  ORF type:complete len:127 (+),score=17.54 TRINITY_DN2333_c0_g2_i1:136-516(+)